MTDTNRYGPTAARKQGKPGREMRPKSTTIDIHSHVGVPAAAAIAQPHLDPSTIPLGAFRHRRTSRRSTPSRRPTAARA